MTMPTEAQPLVTEKFCDVCRTTMMMMVALFLLLTRGNVRPRIQQGKGSHMGLHHHHTIRTTTGHRYSCAPLLPTR